MLRLLQQGNQFGVNATKSPVAHAKNVVAGTYLGHHLLRELFDGVGYRCFGA